MRILPLIVVLVSPLAREVFDGTGTSKSQSLGSLQQVIDEFLKIDKCKIYSTVNCEVNTNVFVYSRLWFLWKTWSYWGCPGKKIKDKFYASLDSLFYLHGWTSFFVFHLQCPVFHQDQCQRRLEIQSVTKNDFEDKNYFS